MFVARSGVGELMYQVEPRPGFVRREADCYARAAGRYRFATREAVSKRDPLGRDHFQHLAQTLHAARMADVNLASGRGIDGRAGSPPAGPPRAVGEESKYSLW